MASTYVFQCKDRQGRKIKGTLSADNEREVVKKLREEGYYVLSVKEKKSSKDISLDFLKPKKPKLSDLSVYCRQMSTMIESGLSLVDTLEILREQTVNPVLQETTANVLQDVEVGKTLHAAVSAHPKVFPPIFRQMIRAGEAGGVLEEVLRRLADHFEKELALNQKVKSAMMYPLVILVVALVVVFFLLTTVIPTFAGLFAGFGGELPLPTRIIMGASDWLRSNWWIVLGIIVVIVIGGSSYKNSPKGKENIDRLVLKFPLTGNLTRKVVIARFSRTLSTLSASGVTLLEALRIVEDVIGNKILADVITQARLKLREGVQISRPLAASGQFPKMVIQMISIGEETGNLDKMLEKVADFYEQEVDTSVQGLVSLIEPAMVVFIAVIVGFIVISVVLPMFDMMQVIV